MKQLFRRRARERPAALRLAGEHRRLFLRPPAGRQNPHDEPRPRRPSHARAQGEFLRTLLRGHPLRRERKGRAHRLRRAGEGRARSEAEDDHRRRQRLLAHHRLRPHAARSPTAWARISSWTWRTSPGSSPAGSIRIPCRIADFVTTTTHKSLRGPRGGIIICKEKFAKAIDSQVFPGIQGGPLEHVIAAKAVCFHEALQPSFKALRRADRDQRQGPRRAPRAPRLPHRQRRHGQSPHARRSAPEGPQRQDSPARRSITPASP